jgi:hypothetical protein
MQTSPHANVGVRQAAWGASSQDPAPSGRRGAQASENGRGVEHSPSRIDGRDLPHPHSEDRVRAGPAHRPRAHVPGGGCPWERVEPRCSPRRRARPGQGPHRAPRPIRRETRFVDHLAHRGPDADPRRSSKRRRRRGGHRLRRDRRSGDQTRRRPGRGAPAPWKAARPRTKRAILLVSDTRHNRTVIAQVPELRRQFPVDTRQCLAALGRGLDPGGDCLVII